MIEHYQKKTNIKLVVMFRGDVSYEFFFPSGDMSNLAYIGAKNLNF